MVSSAYWRQRGDGSSGGDGGFRPRPAGRLHSAKRVELCLRETWGISPRPSASARTVATVLWSAPSQLSDSPVAALRVLLQTAQDRLAPLLAVHMPAVQIDALDVAGISASAFWLAFSK